MAESDVRADQIGEEAEKGKSKDLKYLGFVHVAAIQTLLLLSTVYAYAKENSGSLKSGVQKVEGAVKAVVGPVYDKYHGVPYEVLKFFDEKVGKLIVEAEHHIPSKAKEAYAKISVAREKAVNASRSLMSEVQHNGLVKTVGVLASVAYTKAEPEVKQLYAKYEPVAEKYAVSAWHSANRLPVFPQVAQILVPTAAYWSEKYNKTVIYTAQKGYGISAYLPLVPIEKIGKVFGQNAKKVE